MMYPLANRKVHELLDVLLLVLVLYVHHGFPEVLDSVFNRIEKLCISWPNDELLLLLILDVHHGVHEKKVFFFYERYT